MYIRLSILLANTADLLVLKSRRDASKLIYVHTSVYIYATAWFKLE